jgi:hypothetical protein
MRRREEYDQDHGVPTHSRATRTESVAASTNSLAPGRSRQHDAHSPPRDHRRDHCREDRGRVDYLPLPLTLGDLMAAELQGLQRRQVRTKAGPE